MNEVSDVRAKRCNRCGRVPVGTTECPTCLRELLAEASGVLGHLLKPDGIGTRIGIRFDWKDRLRLLFHGEAQVEIHTKTQFSPGRVESASSVTVRPLIQRKPLQLAEVAPQ